MLKEYEQSRKCKFAIDSFVTGKQMLEKDEKYHIAFLDIDMPEMNGIDVGRSLWRKNKKCFIIYITILNHYRDIAQNQTHSFAYLNKPLNKSLLFQQLDDLNSNLSVLADDTIIRFTTKEYGIIEKYPEDIFYFEFDTRKITMNCKTGKYRLNGNISELAVQMEKYDFAMPHKGFLVNLYYISQIKLYDIIMSNDVIIPLSQKRSVAFRQCFTDYLTKGD